MYNSAAWRAVLLVSPSVCPAGRTVVQPLRFLRVDVPGVAEVDQLDVVSAGTGVQNVARLWGGEV